jgi:hypothetical protein
MRISLLICFLALVFSFLGQQQQDSLIKGIRIDSLKYRVYFDTDKSTLRPEIQHELENWANSNLNTSVKSVQLYGHTDSDGKDLYNEILSEKRCQTVQFVLSELGVKEGMFQSAHFGERQLNKLERDPADKASNRRVEVLALKNVEYEYFIPCAGVVRCPDTMIYLPQGTGIKLDTCALQEKLKCIKIEECVTPEAARIGGMHTMDNEGEALRSGGMIKYDICDGRTVQVFIPIRENCFEPEMDLYEQTKDGWKKIEGQKPEVVEVQGRRFYSFPVSGSGVINCDVRVPAQSKPPKLIFKAKKGLQLVEVRLSCDCPFVIQAVRSKKEKGRKVELIRNCCPEAQVMVTAKLATGKFVELPYGSINRLDPRKSLIGCKTSERKRVLLFKIRKKSMHRAYRVREKHFN